MVRDRLYTPWRMKYVISDKKRSGCIFCNVLGEEAERDRENFVLYRGEEVSVVMNIYPYNVGHVMVIPLQHISTLSAMSRTAQLEMMLLTTYLTELLRNVMNPDGFNIGLNIGKAAGAGIDHHLHLHIVPRWDGDSNFMPIIGETRVLPEELSDTYDHLISGMRSLPPPEL